MLQRSLCYLSSTLEPIRPALRMQPSQMRLYAERDQWLVRASMPPAAVRSKMLARKADANHDFGAERLLHGKSRLYRFWRIDDGVA